MKIKNKLNTSSTSSSVSHHLCVCDNTNQCCTVKISHHFVCQCTSTAIKMPKRKLNKEEDNDIPMFSKYEYSQTLTAFTESYKLMGNELNSLECYSDYQPEALMNSFNDQKLNNHLYVIAKFFCLFLWLCILLISRLCCCVALGNVVRVTLDHTGSYILSQ